MKKKSDEYRKSMLVKYDDLESFERHNEDMGFREVTERQVNFRPPKNKTGACDYTIDRFSGTRWDHE